MGLTVAQLGIHVEGEWVTLTGTTADRERREKLVRLVGNVQEVGHVDDQLQVARTAPEARFYTVKRGDTVSKIAHAHYGDATQYPWIFEANRLLLRDRDEMSLGQTLGISQYKRIGAAALSPHVTRAAPPADDPTSLRRRQPPAAWLMGIELSTVPARGPRR